MAENKRDSKKNDGKNGDGVIKTMAAAVAAAGLTDLAREVVTQTGKGIGEAAKHHAKDFGGSENPEDQRAYYELLTLLGSRKEDPRQTWEKIARAMNAKYGNGWLSQQARFKSGTKRRVVFAAMLGAPPNEKKESKEYKEKRQKDPSWKPLGVHVMTDTVEVYKDEYKMQVESGNAEQADALAQLKAEIYLRDCGFDIPISTEVYQDVDNLIATVSSAPRRTAAFAKLAVEQIENGSVKAAKLLKERLATLADWTEDHKPAARQAVKKTQTVIGKQLTSLGEDIDNAILERQQKRANRRWWKKLLTL